MNISKLSTKGQITIPMDIRKALGIESGDLLAYELDGNSVRIKKVEPIDAVYHMAIAESLEEWNSPEDEDAFKDL